MINFSKIPNSGILGKILRFPLKLLPRNWAIPIWQGVLRGKRWIVGSGVAGYWLGSYELEEQKKIKEHLNVGNVFFDVGAHCGFYSLLAGKLVGGEGSVFAFEPLPQNIFYFKKHVEINGCKNIKLLEAAVGGTEGEARFSEGESTFTGRLSETGNLVVKIIKIDDVVFSSECLPPDFIKIDVEGKQREVIAGALETIKKFKPKILFEADYKLDKEVFDILEEIGYNISPIGDKRMSDAPNFLAIIK